MAKILHFMGTEAACDAALTFLGAGNPSLHYNYSGFDVLSDGEKDHDIEEYVIVVDSYPDFAVKIMRVVGEISHAFCWEIAAELGEREDGNFNPSEDIKVILTGRLRHDEAVATLLLRYEVALEKARTLRFSRPGLYIALCTAVGEIAKLHSGQSTPAKARMSANARRNLRWANGTDDVYEAQNIVFSALVCALDDYIHLHGAQ